MLDWQIIGLRYSQDMGSPRKVGIRKEIRPKKNRPSRSFR